MKSFAKYITESAAQAKELESLPNIYLDLDGTIVDWITDANKALKEHGLPNWESPKWNSMSRDKAEDLKWDAFNSDPTRWHNLRFLPFGQKLWNFVKPYRPAILSAFPDKAEHGVFCSNGKLYWIRKNLGLQNLSNIHLVGREDKKNFAINRTTGRPNILIDDFGRNCREFQLAGGIAIKVENANNVISELKKLGFK